MPDTLNQQDLPEGDPGLINLIKANQLYEGPEDIEPPTEVSTADIRKYKVSTVLGVLALGAGLLTLGAGIQKHRYAA